MAEIVQQVIESSIQDLSILEKYNLFDSNQIKAILKKRREFEYRLRKVKKSKDDFLRYISYEESLLKLIRIKRENSGLEIDKNEVEKTTLDHIKRLYEFAIKKFISDIPLWLSYLNFCKNQNQLDHVSIIYFRMLQIHNKDWLWLQFAKFEFEEKVSSETARKVFLKAISFHPESKQVWHEYFRFELLYCSKIKKRFDLLTKGAEKSEIQELNEKQSNDAIWNGQLASIVYKHAINAFSDFKFAASFIDICNNFHSETVNEVKSSILDDIRSRFGSCEDYFNLLAIDRLNKYKQTIRFEGNISDSEQLKLKQETVGEVISIYETACHNFNNPKMWSFYIQFRLDDLKNIVDSNILAQKITEIIFTVEKLWKANLVTYEIFLEWIKLMYSCNKKDMNTIRKIQKYLLEASEKWPHNLEAHIFIACVKTKLPDKKLDSQVDKFFQESLFRKFIKVDQQNVDMLTDFWQLYLDWSVQNKVSYHQMMKVVTQLNNVCTYAPRKMSEYFKCKVLALFYHMFGIEKARSYYDKNKTVSPICKSFNYKMIDIEKHFAEMQEEGNYNLPDNHVTSIFEDLIHHFGSGDLEIWLNYIRHAMAVDTAKVGALYEKALKCLDRSESHRFVQQYSLLRSMPSHQMECQFAST